MKFWKLFVWLYRNRGNDIIVRDEMDMNGLPSFVFASKTVMVPGAELDDPYVEINGRLYVRIADGPATMAKYLYVGPNTDENRRQVLMSFRNDESEML